MSGVDRKFDKEATGKLTAIIMEDSLNHIGAPRSDNDMRVLIDAVRQCLDAGANPDVYVPRNTRGDALKFHWRHSPMEAAVWHRSAEMVRLLAGYGASPHIKLEGKTLIGMCLQGPPDQHKRENTEKYRAETIKALIECGADPNELTDVIGDLVPPLHSAARDLRFECMKTLADGGAQAEAVAHTKTNLFHGDAIRQILGHGLPWFTRANRGQDLYDASGKFLYSEKKLKSLFSMIDLLLSKMNTVSRKFSVANALATASSMGNTPAIDHLVSAHGADINGLGYGAPVPLCRAIESSDSSMMRLAIEAIIKYPGLDINRVNEDGKSALQIAIERRDTEAVKILSCTGKLNLSQPLRIKSASGHYSEVTLQQFVTSKAKGAEMKALLRALLARESLMNPSPVTEVVPAAGKKRRAKAA